MRQRVIRSFHVFILLVVLISQFGLAPFVPGQVGTVYASHIPTNPSAFGVSISNVAINGGGNVQSLAPGEAFSLSLDYNIQQLEGCPACIDQIEIGYSSDSAPLACAYDGIPAPAPTGTSGSNTLNLTAPLTPGVYFLGFDLDLQFTCADALASWTHGAPDASRYIASVIVGSVTLTVNSTLDAVDAEAGDGLCETALTGDCTLRAAIEEANALPGTNQIQFAIPGGGVKTIAPTAPLPLITDPLLIDGYTQPGASPNTLAVGNNAVLLIELDGSSAGSSDGLALRTSDSVIRGLVVNRFSEAGISVSEVNNLIAGNFVGTDPTGTLDRGNGRDGIFVANFTQPVAANNNRIGGSAPADRNVISANGNGIPSDPRNGITLDQVANTIIQGNYIGTNAAGTAALGNYQSGIGVFRGSSNIIGGMNPGEGNLISGNGFDGIGMGDLFQTGLHRVQGNLIGTNASGSPALGNGRDGVRLTTPGVVVEGNTIAGNGGAGIWLLDGAGNEFRANSIFSNTGLGIDLGGDGLTFNHEGFATGPNNYQNYPVLDVATSNGSATRVVGTLVGDENGAYTIDVYANTSCDPGEFGEGQTHLGVFNVVADGNGVAAFDHTLNTGVSDLAGITATATGSDGTSEFSYCRPATASNLNWVQALAVTNGSQTQQYITDRFQERWFKFPVQPGATVTVTLNSLPGSAVSLHRDPRPIYDSLIDPQNAAVLTAQVADTAFLPSGSLPSGSLPSGSLPSGSLPSGSLPSGSLPTGYLPSGSLPSGSLPSGSLPSGSLPSGSLPSGSLPSGSLPSGSLPSGSLPSGSLPSGSLPSGSLPSGSLPSGSLPSGSLPSGSLDAYASAARRSLLGISMDPYATVQTIERNTYDLQENLYVRVVGPYSLTTPFTLRVNVQGGVCGPVQAVPVGTPVTSGISFPAAAYQTLILTDSSRLTGTATEKSAALAALENAASQSYVAGKVVDLASGYPRVAFANGEADDHPACAFAKNTVADEIKKVIDAYRAEYPGIEYIVLAGGADVIPFFQVQDVSGLANEREYVVPVAPNTASEAGLQTNLVQGQDGYGSDIEFTQAGHTLALPNLAVGRLPGSANDISLATAAFVQTGGQITTDASLVTGYDFVGDAAEVIRTEMQQGTGTAPQTLIQAPGLPPTDPSAWTADELKAKLLAENYDIAVLTGHFSAGSLLAADYTTELTAAEIARDVDVSNVLFLALGCHGGYNVADSDLLAGVSPNPDWARMFLREGAAGYVSATGYAYGDTELTEYGERLFVLLTQQLRTGSGPIPVGKAVVAAKQQYLAEMAQLTGIDHKTIVEMTLYGFPMMKVNMPGARRPAASYEPISNTPATVGGGPGQGIGLRASTVALGSFELNTQTVQLTNLADNSTVNTTYLVGENGVVSNPFEPIFPKKIYDIAVSNNLLRGVAFRGGTYTDTAGVIPTTSSPATETSTVHQSFNTGVFYPTQVWASNYYDAADGGRTRLIVFPSQFKSSTLGAIDGTRRVFTDLDLELYYLPSNWATAGSPETQAAAVSGGPVILGASADEESGQITFRVNAVAEGSAGVQAVWVLYTGNPGSSAHGTWSPVDLTQNSDDPTLWEGVLSLPSGTDADDVLFMVQAVGGAGLTALATNLGAYYSVHPQSNTPPPPPQATTLTLTGPSSGTYLEESTFTLTLEQNNQALGGQLVSLDVGGQQAFGVTNGSGQVTLSLTPVLEPDDYTAQARFGGNAAYLGSNDSKSFQVNKDTTSLTVTPASASVQSGQAMPFIATLKDSSGETLGGKSVIFVLRSNSDHLAFTRITDFRGNAALGEISLPAGTYTLDVYFSGNIPVAPGETLTLEDAYYEDSRRLGLSLTVSNPSSTPTITVTATRADNTPYTADTWSNQTVTVDFVCQDVDNDLVSCVGDAAFATDGTFTANGTATDNAGNTASASFGPIKIDKTAPTLAPTISPNPVPLNGTATVSAGATDNGSGIATQSCGAIDTSSAGAKSVTCTATDNAGNTSTAILSYQVVAGVPANAVLDTFDRANGKVGSNWALATGTSLYRIAGNRLDVQAGGALIWRPTSFGVTQEAFVTLSTIDSRSTSQGLILKAQSTSRAESGLIIVVYDARAGAVRVSTLRSNRPVWTNYGNTTVSFANGDQLAARALSNGKVEIYKNGVLVATVTLNASDQAFFNTKGGRIGLWTLAAPNAFFDNFGGGNVSVP